MKKFFSAMLTVAVFLLLLSPLFVLHSVLYPYVFGKVAILQLIVILTLPALIFFLLNREFKFLRKDWVTKSLVVYIAVIFLSALQGMEFWQSFWGSDERSFGLFVLLHIFAAFFIFIFPLKDERRREQIIIFASLTGAISALIGIIEYWQTGGSRSTALFGNPILYAGYLLFPLFFSLYLAGRKRGLYRAMFLAITFEIFLALIFAQSRGALLGMIVGLLAGLVFLMFFLKKGRKKIVKGALLSIIIFVLAIFILNASGNKKVKGLIRRFGSITLKDASSSQRLHLYGIALEAAKDRPLLGWGWENFDYAFDRNYDPWLLKYGVSETWSDRSHNAFLDALVMSGILGLLAYLCLFASAGFTLFRSAKSSPFAARDNAILFSLLIAYGVHNFFAFDSSVSFLYFIFFLALISAQNIQYIEKTKIENSHAHKSIFIGLAAFSLMLVPALKNERASVHMRRATDLPPAAAKEKAKEIEKALKINPPLIRDFRLRLANMAFEEAGIMPKPEARTMLDLAISEMEKNAVAASSDFAYRFALGNLYLERGMLFGSTEDFKAAEEAYRAAEKLSPARQALYFQLASLKLVEHKPDEAVKLLEKAVSFDPDLGQPHWRLGIAYAYNGETNKALKSWRQALRQDIARQISYSLINSKTIVNIENNINYTPSMIKEVRFASDLAFKEKDYELLRELVLISIALQPDKSAYVAQLSTIELELDNFEAARAAANKVKELDPSSAAEADLFLNEIDNKENSHPSGDQP